MPLRQKNYLIGIFIGIGVIVSARADLIATTLRCEYQHNPPAVDTSSPRLSWVLESTDRDVYQSAYQILMASSETLLENNKGDIGDTGKIISEDQNQIAYTGRPLAPFERVFWKVRVWDKNDTAGPWSQSAQLLAHEGLRSRRRLSFASDNPSAPLYPSVPF